jgi:hypothetical protein
MKKIIFLLVIIFSLSVTSQVSDSQLPYYEIPDYPETYTAGTVAARMVDGLGFRYYWATDSLRPEDLAYKPNDEARTTLETIDHIYGLSKVIVNATLQKPNIRLEEDLTFEEKRKKTLENIKTAADILRASDDLSKFDMVFQRENGNNSEFPFWNNINGPIADAIWHCGQVVVLRRSSGNPFTSKVSLLRGRLRDK